MPKLIDELAIYDIEVGDSRKLKNLSIYAISKCLCSVKQPDPFSSHYHSSNQNVFNYIYNPILV